MTTADFLLELRCEEIPARMQAGARRDLGRMFTEELARAGLSSGAVEVFSTPRRLALIAREVPLQTQARREEVKGPRSSAPPQALDGFLRKTGLTREQLEERDGVFFAAVETPGQATLELLAPIIERIVRGFPWPKSMRWGEASATMASLRWVRPLHGIVAMLGEEIVPVAIEGVEAGAATLGHRFHHPGQITIGGAHDYAQKLRACHVIVDHCEREALIRDGAATTAAEAGLSLVEDEGLVAENAGLAEWPVPLLGRFEPDYLDVPREVIVLTMRANQKYFACTGAGGELAPAFVCVANIDAADGGAGIVEGNKRVLAARLADARFFWEQDLKVPLEEQAKKLGGIVFHEKLGTIADKVERVANLAGWLAKEGIVPDCPPELARHAAELAKADLVTGMVGEFPELQGVIGGYLARAQGEPSEVADAVRDHYKPVRQGDEVPLAPLTVAVSLADKLDTLVGFFAVGLAPTGSKDPFAVRRAALAFIQTVLDNAVRLRLHAAIEAASEWLSETLNVAWQEWDTADFWDLYATENNYRVADVDGRAWLFHANTAMVPLSESFSARQELMDQMMRSISEAPSLIVPFLADRLKVQQREAGVRHDLIDAVFAVGGEDDLVRLLARVKALQAFIETPEGADLLTGYKRAANILKREKWEGEGVTRLSATELEPQEAALVAALDAAEPKASAAVEAEDFTGAMAALASLREPIDAFFDHVTVNDPDAAKRARRLNLLMRFRDAVHRVADFSRIEG